VTDSDSKTQNSSDPAADSQTVTAIPIAVVGPSRISFSDMLRGSYMWLVALLCLVVAIGVAWWSMPEQGIKITIRFPDGHGLAVEDAVRFRGIDVGIVEEVKLNRELSGVDVLVNLSSFAEPLAREGTRFWIVRPKLGLGGISGLETAVGNKYIGLIPGDPEGAWQSSFDGLADVPPDALENRGIEILLQGERRSSVTAGSPVTYRGVVIGRVLSVGLSPDGLKVDVRLRILEKFTKLVTSESKFWASGGIDASFSPLSGSLSFEMESIETLVQGGVSVLTIAEGGRPIDPGDDFVLHVAPEDGWFEQAEQVQATDVRRRGAIPLEVAWDQKGFLGRLSKKSKNIIGTHFHIGSNDFAMIPADVLVLPEKGIPDSLQIRLANQSEMSVPVNSEMLTDSDITQVLLPSPTGFSYPTPIVKNEMRVPDTPESCLAIRANGEFEDLRYLSLSIDAKDIGDDWVVNNFDGDRSVWHGAPVLSESDGKLIGILLVGEKETRISILTETRISQ
jgi:paraquat-inducible protein B